MSRMQLLKKLILQYKYQLGLTYLLFTLEMAGLLLRPFFLAMAVDGLLKGQYNGLIYLGLVQLAWMAAGTVRHMYDTRTYSAIYTALVTKFLARRYEHGHVSRLSAHSNLAREFVNFLETDLVYILEAAYNLLGALILLLYLDPNVVWVCLVVLVPVTLISKRYGRKMQNLYQRKNDELEQQVDIISSGNRTRIKHHYNSLRLWQIRISDQEARNFGVMEIMVLVAMMASLLVATSGGKAGVTVGHLMAIGLYIQTFMSGLDTVPYVVERFSSLKDITRRIELGEDDFEEASPTTASVVKAA
jgi:ABC-type multidrug transport system fused ATPase/permease subunit